MITATNVACYFIKKGLDSPSNTLEGNKKLQKLLVFANLIYLSQTGNLLFNDKIYAFKEGCVVEKVRQEYRNNWYDIVRNSEIHIDFSPQQREVLEKTEKIFGNLSAGELSELHHKFYFWNRSYTASINDGYAYKEDSIVTKDDMQSEIGKIDEILVAYKTREKMINIIINGIVFYYNPVEVFMSNELETVLIKFAETADEESYTIHYDETEGYLIS